MPVARNLSLPSSIESRKKKRPETLFHRSNTEVQDTTHCTIQRRTPVNLSLPKVNRPSFLTATPIKKLPSVGILPLNNCHNNSKSNEEISNKNASNSEVAERTKPDEIVMGVDTAATRGGTLSQPCLSIRNVGATQIFPHLFLGSQKDVVDEKMMRSNDITYVLNVSKTCVKPSFIEDGHFHRISVHDSYQEKMTPHMLEAIDFIEKVRKSNERVIVHCLAGVSRSATVAIAYVLHYLRISFEEAYRFVKEKRPSISPNFNFLGQLMEFEKSLRKSGHLTIKTTGSLSSESDEETIPQFSCCKPEEESTTMKTGTVATKRASLKLNFFETKTDSAPLIMPVTCSFKCGTQATAPYQATGSTLRISPTSSLSKRRNGPTFIKGAFSISTSKVKSNKSSNEMECNSALPKFLGGKSPFEKSGLVLDVRVDSPAASRVSDASRRLGSDGFEKYESMACEPEASTFADTFSPLGKQEAVVVAEEPQSMDCSILVSEFENKPRTAPNTPVIGRSKSEKSPPWRSGQLTHPKTLSRHRRSASGGGISSELLQSFGMKRRFDTQHDAASAGGDHLAKERSSSSPMIIDDHSQVKRGSSFSGSYYNHSEPSTRSPHKFVSINARSPKILRKSMQLNVKPLYSHGKGLKAEESTACVSTPSVLAMDSQPLVFDCTHTMSENNPRLKISVESANPDHEVDSYSMSPLTLSSPTDDDHRKSPFSNVENKLAASPATCPVMSSLDPFTRIDNPSSRFLCKGSFTCSANRSRNTKTTQNTILSPPETLRLKWRCSSNRRRQSVDSGYLSSSQNSSQASSSFTSPTSQQGIFSAGSLVRDSFPEIPIDDATRTPSPSTCHLEGALFSSDDVNGSNSDSDSHKSNVRQRNAMELVSCS